MTYVSQEERERERGRERERERERGKILVLVQLVLRPEIEDELHEERRDLNRVLSTADTSSLSEQKSNAMMIIQYVIQVVQNRLS